MHAVNVPRIGSDVTLLFELSRINAGCIVLKACLSCTCVLFYLTVRQCILFNMYSFQPEIWGIGFSTLRGIFQSMTHVLSLHCWEMD